MKYLCASALVLVLTAGAAGCADEKAPSQAVPVSADEAAIQVITRDLAPVLARSTDGLVVQAIPGGGQRVNVQGRFQSAAIAKIGPDGKLVTDCAETVEDAETFLRAAPAKADR